VQVRRPGEGRTINLGTFETPEVAAQVHDVYWYYRLGPILAKEYLNLPDFIERFLAEKSSNENSVASSERLDHTSRAATYNVPSTLDIQNPQVVSPRGKRDASREGSFADSPRAPKRPR